MDILFVLGATVLIENSRSQTLSKSPDCLSIGDQLTLTCETTDFLQGINFNLNTNDQGGCVPSVGCAVGITQSGTTTTILTISSFDVASHSGSWKCTYGVSTSSAVTIAENSCNSSSKEGLSDREKLAIACGSWLTFGIVILVLFLLLGPDGGPVPVIIVFVLLLNVVAVLTLWLISKKTDTGDPDPITVDPPPNIKKIQAKVGNPVKLLPNLEQDFSPLTSVEWKRNEQTVFWWTSGHVDEGVIHDKVGSILNVSKEDDGLWRCIVKYNDNKSIQYDVTLTVIE